MIQFTEIFDKAKEGDVILTRSHLGKSKRKVKFENGGIILNGHSFNWDYFFEVNDVIKIL